VGLSIRYAGGHLDRASLWRHDAPWIAERLTESTTILVPVWRDRSLFDRPVTGGSPLPVLLPRAAFRSAHQPQPEDFVFLGLDGTSAVFAVDLSAREEADAQAACGRGEFTDLRVVGPSLEPRHAALLAYARGILHWHRTHRHCGRCGSRTTSAQGGHIRRCSSAECARELFPRTDPAIIVLVEHDAGDGSSPRCLLGHHGSLPTGSFSTLAGFVEPGESLEEAVVREVREEVGLTVRNVRYLASQPWPFPASLMVGFRARAESLTVTVDGKELVDARWFTPAELRRAGEWGDAEAVLRLPRRDSIARFLIETWLMRVDPTI